MTITFRLEIEMENAAFTETEGAAPLEVARIIGRLSEQLNRRGADFHLGEGGVLLDINGNTIGKWTITRRPPPLEVFGQGDPIEKI